MQAQRLGRPASSKGAVLRASTWFDEVAAPQMQQMCMVQKDAVKVHDQALDEQVQELTASLAQASAAAFLLYLLCTSKPHEYSQSCFNTHFVSGLVLHDSF